MSVDEAGVRRLGPDDWRITRDLRLSALKEDERWFGGNYADSAARTEQQWRDWPGGGTVFAAYADGAPVGLVAGIRPENRDGQAELIAMWVGSAGRGRGLAARLIDAVADDARADGCTELWLEVLSGNDSARRAYERYGFTVSDAPVRDEDHLAMRYLL